MDNLPGAILHSVLMLNGIFGTAPTATQAFAPMADMPTCIVTRQHLLEGETGDAQAIAKKQNMKFEHTVTENSDTVAISNSDIFMSMKCASTRPK